MPHEFLMSFNDVPLLPLSMSIRVGTNLFHICLVFIKSISLKILLFLICKFNGFEWNLPAFLYGRCEWNFKLNGYGYKFNFFGINSNDPLNCEWLWSINVIFHLSINSISQQRKILSENWGNVNKMLKQEGEIVSLHTLHAKRG